MAILDPRYNGWRDMRNRCSNPNHPKYKYYGAQGVKVCQQWQDSFGTFCQDMGPRPPGYSLDRFPDKNGDYKPGNCRWASLQEQNENRRPRGAWKRLACANSQASTQSTN